MQLFIILHANSYQLFRISAIDSNIKETFRPGLYRDFVVYYKLVLHWAVNR